MENQIAIWKPIEFGENWLTTNTNREKVRERCYEIIDNYYNPKYQLKVFNCLLNDENPEI